MRNPQSNRYGRDRNVSAIGPSALRGGLGDGAQRGGAEGKKAPRRERELPQHTMPPHPRGWSASLVPTPAPPAAGGRRSDHGTSRHSEDRRSPSHLDGAPRNCRIQSSCRRGSWDPPLRLPSWFQHSGFHDCSFLHPSWTSFYLPPAPLSLLSYQNP